METLTWLYTLFLPLLLLLATTFARSTQKLNLPPSPPLVLPIIGHLYLLKQPLHRTYHHLSNKFGPIFSLRFGNRLVVVISSPAAVEECFTKNDIVLANRPLLIITKYLGYNHTTLAASPYGEHWRNLRRLTAIEIFSASRLNKFLSTREDEIRLLLQKLYQNSMHEWGKVELKSLFTELSFNIIMRMITGKRYFGDGVDNEEAKQFQRLMREALRQGGASNPADFFPVLRWIDYKNYEKNLSNLFLEMDAFFQALIDKHRHNENTDSMIDHLLSFRSQSTTQTISSKESY